MVLTKQDLRDWNSHPVTKQIMKEIDNAANELAKESVIRKTVDETAMQASFNEGVLAGAQILRDTYEDLEEASE